MRPSSYLVALVLALTAATVIMSLWLTDPGQALAWMWGTLVTFVLADLVISAPTRRLGVEVDLPVQGFVGQTAAMQISIQPTRGFLPKQLAARPDLDAEIAPDGDEQVILAPAADSARTHVRMDLPLRRRGRYAVRALWLQWPTRLRMLEIIASTPVNREILVLPDVSPVLSGAIHTQILPLQNGQKDMRLRGEGSEFHQLREFAPGMDPRSIDWKRSARVRDLVVRETRAERNHQIILCVDCGRLMAEQLAGLPKLDRAINAALAMCWAGGLAGDLVGFYGFDSRPRLFAPALPGRAAFPRLQTLCAQLRYESLETNHTLGLTHLSGQLRRRSLVVIFSDFVDSITAELMVENMGILARRHFIVYVTLRDPALAKLVEPDDITPDSIARSVAARQILQERRAVMEKLARLGVLCLDSTPETLTTDLVAHYMDIKSRELI